MGRQRKWASEAERKRAARARSNRTDEVSPSAGSTGPITGQKPPGLTPDDAYRMGYDGKPCPVPDVTGKLTPEDNVLVRAWSNGVWARQQRLDPEPHRPGYAPKKVLPLPTRRDHAIARGRALGESEAARLRETGSRREDRIRRAMKYAAWEYDGKPTGRNDEYDAEFGLASPQVVASFDRPPPPPLKPV